MHISTNRFKLVVKTSCPSNRIISFDSLSSTYKIELKAKPVEGQANKELVKFLSKELGRPVRIKSGFTSKKKIIELL